MWASRILAIPYVGAPCTLAFPEQRSTGNTLAEGLPPHKHGRPNDAPLTSTRGWRL